MPTPINLQAWDRYQKEIEKCLREGFTPLGRSGGKGSAVEEAQRRLRAEGLLKPRNLLATWVGVQRRRAARGLEHRLPDWGLYGAPTAARVDATSRVVERYILTAAQNDTDVHRPFFHNLQALASYYGAKILVGKFTYQTLIAGDRSRSKDDRKREPTWRPELVPFLTQERVPIGNLLFCAEMNTLPTAVRPLSGLHTYGQGRTAIFPHAKVALEMVPSAVGMPPAVLTTGCCTVPSYTDTKAGHKGIFHHVLGAVVVEIDDAGRTFFRHVSGRSDGELQELDLIARDGRVTSGHRVEAINFGDIHSPFIDPAVALGTFGFDVETWARAPGARCMIDDLRPQFGFFHDLIDFKSISPHELKKPRERFRVFLDGGHCVESDLHKGGEFLKATSRDFMKSVVVESNHGRWLERWLDTADHRADRDNALCFLKLERARMEAEAAGDREFNVMHYALREAAGGRLAAAFVPEGGSYVIAHEHGGIECGAHGNLGPNGAKGTPTSLMKVAGKANYGDKHAPGVYDGIYVAGVSCKLDMGYNVGPSSWAHAYTLTYVTGKRALVFFQEGRWRA